LSGDQIVHRGRDAAIGDVARFRTDRGIEQQAGEMRGGADAGAAVVERAGLCGGNGADARKIREDLHVTCNV